MAEAQFVIEEYIWLDEGIQGNINVAGLVWDDLLEETIEFGREDVLTVFSEQLQETLGLTEAFAPVHQAAVGDVINIYEFFGTPLRVRQSVMNMIMTSPLTPAQIAHVHLDILHGIDVYWEAVSSELQCHSSYANAVPYYWEYIYDSLDIDMTEPQPQPPLYLVLKLLENDLVNMRHEVSQEYLFNSKCFDALFIWSEQTWGWVHAVASEIGIAESVREIIGKVADDYLLLREVQDLKLKVKHAINDAVFAFDRAVDEKFYLMAISETIDFADVVTEIFGHVVTEALILQGVPVSGIVRNITAAEILNAVETVLDEKYYIELVDEEVDITDGIVAFVAVSPSVTSTLRPSDTASTLGSYNGLAYESLVFADFDSYIHALLIDEGLAIEDVGLARWAFNVLVESGCNVADIIG